MQMTSDTRETLQHYKALINASRREAGLSTLNTPRILEEICLFLKYQDTLYIGSAFIRQDGAK